MLYNLLKFLFALTVKGYFRSIYIKGLENVPKTGPVMFAPNHTSAFMDPILLGTQIDRKLYFLARGDVFKNKLAAIVFGWLNMIPVFRAEHDSSDMHKNEQVFQRCFDHLAKRGAIMIFPEGLSKTERRLRPIKTGTARIALGAENQNNFELGTQIIPIGLNYSNPHFFRGDVFVNFGKAIEVSEYKSAFEKNNWDGVTQLTERIKTELEKLVVIIEDERLDKLIKQIEILYRSKLRDESDPNEKAPQDFYLSKDIVKAVEFYAKTDPEHLESFEKKIDTYLQTLRRLGIRDTQVRMARIPFNVIWTISYFILGFPIFAFGMFTNYIPYRLAGVVALAIPLRDDFVGSIKMASGMFIFLLFYLVEFSLVVTFTNYIWGIAFLVALYPAGLFTVNYIKKYYEVRGILKYIHLFIRKSNLITQLKSTRNQLVEELEKAKESYLIREVKA